MPKNFRNALVHRGHTEMRNAQSLIPDLWEPIGPNGITANCIAVDPTNANTIYVGGLSGLYKTTDGGVHWVVANTQFLNKYVYAAVIHPVDPAIVFAWVEDSLMKSTDGGGTWNSVLGITNYNYYDRNGKIFIDAKHPQNMLTYSDSVYYSTDGGNYWFAIGPFGNVSAIAIYQQNPMVIYAIGDSSYGPRLFKTTDGGQNWIAGTSQLPTALTDYSLGSFQVSSSDSNVIFAGNSSLIDTIGGFYRSVDGGLTWQRPTAGFGRSNSVSVIENDPLDPNSVYAGGSANGLYRSTDLGDSWTLISGSIADWYSSALYVALNGNLYCAFGGGMYFTTNQGGSWESFHGDLQNIDVFDLITDPSNANVLYATSLGGMYRTQDGGMTWQQRNNGMLDNDAFALALDPQNPNTLFAGTFGGLIYKTTDDGATWLEKSNGLLGFGYGSIWKIAVHPRNTSWVWTSQRFPNYQSTDGGESWSQFFINGQKVQEAVCDARRPDTLYAIVGVSADTLLRTTNGGTSWSLRMTGVRLSLLTIDSNTPDVLYADSSEWGVAKSATGGLTWNRVDAESPRDIFVNQGNSAYVYESTFGLGVRCSTNGGSVWGDYNNGLPYLNTFTVRSDAGQPNRLFVSTFGGGVYKVDQTVTSVKDRISFPHKFSLSQNYPNPFNPATTISYSVPKTAHVTLKVYDLLGKEVSVVVNDLQEAGLHQTHFDGSILPSGIYFYRLEAGESMQTRKLVLIK